MPAHTFFIRALSALLLLAAPRVVHASEVVGVLAEYRVASWSEQDGLPAGTIWAITQDTDGFLWLGTDAGLVRFDGARFERAADLGYQLPIENVRATHVSRDGSLWVVFGSGRVFRIKDRALVEQTTEQGLPPGGATGLAEDHEGGLWLTSRRGVYRHADGVWRDVADAVGLTHESITLSSNPSGTLTAISRNSVYIKPAGASRFAPVATFDQLLVDANAHPDGRVLVTDRIVGLRVANGHNISTRQNGKGMRLMFDRAGNLWVATFGQGLWRVQFDGNDRRVEVATDVNGLSNNVIYALFEDRDGNIWAGTTDGLNRLTRHRVGQISSLGLVTGLEAAPDGGVWAATAEGVVRLSPTGEERARFDSVRAQATHVDAEGALWVAVEEGLLRIPDGPGAQPQWMSRDLRDIRAIGSDASGAVVLADATRGLLRWHNGAASPVAHPDNPTQRVTALHGDRAGTTWLGYTNGRIAALRHGGAARVYEVRNGLDVGVPREFFEDAAGALWVAGSRGLARIADGQAVSFRREAGLPTESLTGVIEDTSGDIWIGAATGVIRLHDPKAATTTSQPSFAMYDAADGVGGTSGWIGQRSSIRGSDGRLWFLTASGITVIDPATMRREPLPQQLRIEYVTADDSRSPVAAMASIAPRVTRLQISYTLPNLTSPRRTRFRYRLEGFDSSWIEAGRQRVATYTNLPPRDYTFVVEATTDGGTWEGPQASWQFTVQPVFYQTPWFMALAATVVVGAAWSAWRLRVLQVRRQFAMLLAERTRLSRELHDTLLQSFVGVALQCDSLASEPATNHETLRAGLVRLRRQVEGYIRECRQSIWDLRSPTLQDGDIISALHGAGRAAADAAGMSFEMRMRGRPAAADPRVDEQLLRIGREAVANAARHSNASRITIELEYRSSAVALRVADNGRGFDPAHPLHDVSGHYGLMSMRERAASVGGHLAIASNAMKGTIVEALLPLAAGEAREPVSIGDEQPAA